MSEGVTSLASAAYKYPTTIQSTFLFVDVGGVVKSNTQEYIFNPHSAHTHCYATQSQPLGAVTVRPMNLNHD